MHKLLTIFLLLSLTATLHAQRRPRFNPEAYRMEQREYILSRAGLTGDEANVFFSLYDAMRRSERKLFSKIRRNRQRRPTTDDECRQAVIDKDNAELRLKKIQMQYHQKMLRTLPPSKVMLCLLLAEKFDREKLRLQR